MIFLISLFPSHDWDRTWIRFYTKWFIKNYLDDYGDSRKTESTKRNILYSFLILLLTTNNENLGKKRKQNTHVIHCRSNYLKKSIKFKEIEKGHRNSLKMIEKGHRNSLEMN